MKLQDCTMGKLVCMMCPDNMVVEKVGMVVGITNNCPSGDLSTRQDPSRAIPLVQWSFDSQPVGVHYGNLVEFKDSML